MLLKLFYNISFKIKPNKHLQVPFRKWKIVRGDEVILRSGIEKKKTGKVIKVFRKANRVLVQGLNVKSKIQKNDDGTKKVKYLSYPIHISKVALIDPVLKVATRVFMGYNIQDQRKLRISKKSKSVIQKPVHQNLQRSVRGKNKVDGPKDTPATKVIQVTYKGEDLESIKKEFEAFIAQKQRRQKLLIFN